MIKIKALVRKKIFDCPQCRKSQCSKSSSPEDFPQNNLLISLVDKIKENCSSKAMCPQCKKVNDVVSCDHCFQIFCTICHKEHFKSVIGTIQSRIEKIENISKETQYKKEILQEQKTATVNYTIEQMNYIQNQILLMFNNHKAKLVNQVHQFYQNKIKYFFAEQNNIFLSLS